MFENRDEGMEGIQTIRPFLKPKSEKRCHKTCLMMGV
jgi:hypothetical protein